MSIKVCHITSVHQRYATRIFHKKCTSLANTGYDVTLLVADGKKDKVSNNILIISTDFILKRDIIDKLNYGLCVLPNDIEELCQAMSYFIDNSSLTRNGI